MTDYYSQTIDFIRQWIPSHAPHPKEQEKIIIREIRQVAPKMSGFIRVAGISGFLAVALGAYGAHAFRHKENNEELKHIFDTGSRYHFFHTLALLAVPLTKRPSLVGCLLTAGMVLFCGSCYYHALTGNTAIRRVTPYGGILLMAGWASMIF